MLVIVKYAQYLSTEADSRLGVAHLSVQLVSALLFSLYLHELALGRTNRVYDRVDRT